MLTKEQSTFDKHGNHEIIVLEPAVVSSAASVIGAEHYQSVVSDSGVLYHVQNLSDLRAQKGTLSVDSSSS